MDNTLTHGTYLGDISLEFREARWRRAGATDDEVAAMEAIQVKANSAQQYAENAAIDRVSDGDLYTALEVMRQNDAFGGLVLAAPVHEDDPEPAPEGEVDEKPAGPPPSTTASQPKASGTGATTPASTPAD